MLQRRNRASDVMFRMWHELFGEHYILTTFWPQDYRRGANYTLDGRTYRITQYRHAADERFYEVWGVLLPGSVPDQQIQPAITES